MKSDDTQTEEGELIAEEAAPETSADVADAAADEADSPSEPKAAKRSKLPIVLALLVIAGAAAVGWVNMQSGDETNAADTTDAAEPSVATTTSEPARANSEPATERQQPLATGDIIERASVADVDALKRDIESLQRDLDAMRESIDGNERAVAAQARTSDRLEKDIEQRVDLLDSLPGRVRNNEEALATLQGISAGSRRAWLIAEAEYYLQIANAQMQLANNPALAAAAMELADQRVRELADPAFTAVRRKIREELTALNSINQTDIEGVTLTLGSLAAMIPGLPLQQETPQRASRERSDDPDATGWSRVKQSTGDFFSDMVRVRDANDSDRPMLSPDAAYFLRLNVQLQLQAARLSLLLGESVSYEQTLQDAEAWLKEYFVPTDAGVIAALDMLGEVSNTEFVDERPDISGSLTLLRQLRDIGSASE
ncbi:MAG: uroporphyrinogen-III C-methyltransferase [Pseudomonadota bacterium]